MRQSERVTLLGGPYRGREVVLAAENAAEAILCISRGIPANRAGYLDAFDG
jgi:hypothetical protein